MYQVNLTRPVRAEIRALPGNMRQRVLRAIEDFKEQPLPPRSKVLEVDDLGFPLPNGLRLCRLRLENWRIIYAVEDEIELVTILAVRKRPPYQYGDLEDLIAEI